MNELIQREKKAEFQSAKQCIASHKSALHITEEQVDELAADWMKFEEDFDPQGETHPWKLKYLVALAFCKGWEAGSDR